VPESEHPYDAISADLQGWMDEEVNHQVEAMRGGYRTPFTAPLTERQKHAEFQRMMYEHLPDGTIQYDKPNKAGRDQVMQTYGVEGYAQVMDAVRPKPGRREAVAEEPEPDLLEPDEPEDDEDDDDDEPEPAKPVRVDRPRRSPLATPV
jgi:hypothetical protein